MAKKYEFTYFLTEKLYEVTDSIDGSLGSEDMDPDDIRLEKDIHLKVKKRLPIVNF